MVRLFCSPSSCRYLLLIKLFLLGSFSYYWCPPISVSYHIKLGRREIWNYSKYPDFWIKFSRAYLISYCLESISLSKITSLVASPEPFHSLLRSTMGKSIGYHPSGSSLLNGIISNCTGGT